MQSDDRNYEQAGPGGGISRRESLKWFGLLLAGNAVAAATGCRSLTTAVDPEADAAGHWPSLDLAPTGTAGYGQDPDLVSLTAGPWPRTLTQSELETVARLADILVPREGDLPSAADLEVEAVVDEWVSAPYDAQRQDRVPVVSLLHWLDDESELRFGKPFADIDRPEQLEIVNDIAWFDTGPQFRRAADAFHRLRTIVVAAYFSSPAGSRDLGYLGGVAIAGDYPGPTPAAMQHLREVLRSLGLDEVPDPALQTA